MRNQFYQTALGNCRGLKVYQNADCSLKKCIVSFIIIFGTLSFPIGNGERREPALCQLYRHTFVPHVAAAAASWSKGRSQANDMSGSGVEECHSPKSVAVCDNTVPYVGQPLHRSFLATCGFAEC